MKYLLDTNVYINAFRSQKKKDQFRASFFPLLPSTDLSSVVAYELHVSAQDRQTRRLVQEFVGPLERAGRVVNPDFSDWTDAAALVATLEEKERGWRSKLPALLNDVLIALCARRIGATLLTHNAKDFRLIHRHKEFSLRILQEA